jgi:hypothetical protein
MKQPLAAGGTVFRLLLRNLGFLPRDRGFYRDIGVSNRKGEVFYRGIEVSNRNIGYFTPILGF